MCLLKYLISYGRQCFVVVGHMTASALQETPSKPNQHNSTLPSWDGQLSPRNTCSLRQRKERTCGVATRSRPTATPSLCYCIFTFGIQFADDGDAAGWWWCRETLGDGIDSADVAFCGFREFDLARVFTKMHVGGILLDRAMSLRPVRCVVWLSKLVRVCDLSQLPFHKYPKCMIDPIPLRNFMLPMMLNSVALLTSLSKSLKQ